MWLHVRCAPAETQFANRPTVRFRLTCTHILPNSGGWKHAENRVPHSTAVNADGLGAAVDELRPVLEGEAQALILGVPDSAHNGDVLEVQVIGSQRLVEGPRCLVGAAFRVEVAHLNWARDGKDIVVQFASLATQFRTSATRPPSRPPPAASLIQYASAPGMIVTSRVRPLSTSVKFFAPLMTWVEERGWVGAGSGLGI
eukprot:scaffold120820_cov51-Phaeocystis_antarctica.AAC.1